MRGHRRPNQSKACASSSLQQPVFCWPASPRHSLAWGHFLCASSCPLAQDREDENWHPTRLLEVASPELASNVIRLMEFKEVASGSYPMQKVGQ